MSRLREAIIATGIALAIAGSVGFMVSFALRENTQWQGAALALAFAGFMAAAIGWAKWVLPHEQVEEQRDVGVPSTRASHDALLGVVRQAHDDNKETSLDIERGLGQIDRRKWLTRMLVAAFGVFGLAALFPIGALGPEPDDTLFHTKWRRGLRLQRADGSFVKVDDVNADAVVTIFPEGNVDDAQSVAVLLRMPDGVGKNVLNGYIAYSKVCTHAGCPVALYRAADQQLVCPCHQSVFDAANDAAVLDGPADHALPRLPLQLGDDGYLRADGDFPEPVGPGFWERG